MMTAIGLTLVWSAIHLTLFLLVGLVLSLLTRRHGVREAAQVTFCFLILSLPLTALSWLPIPNTWGLTWRSARLDAPRPGSVVVSPSQPESVKRLTSTASMVADQSQVTQPRFVWLDWMRRSVSYLTPMAIDAGVPREQRRWPAIVALIVLSGIVLMLLWLSLGMSQLALLVRRSRLLSEPALRSVTDELCEQLKLNRGVTLRESSEIWSAATVGWFRPVVLLPNHWREWSAVELRMVLAHELAHVQRGDFLCSVIARVCLAVHFYHPLVHWFVARMQLQQELIADDQAARLVKDRTTYLRVLASLSLRQDDERTHHWACAFLPTRNTLSRRITMLRNGLESVTEPRRGMRWTIVAIGLLAAGAIASVRVQADDEPPAKVPASTAEAPRATKPVDPTAVSDIHVVENGEVVPQQPKRHFDTIGVMRVRPAQFFARREAKALIPLFDSALTTELHRFAASAGATHVAAIDEMTGTVSYSSPNAEQPDAKQMIAVGLTAIKVVDGVDLLAALREYFPSAKANRGEHAIIYEIDPQDVVRTPIFPLIKDETLARMVGYDDRILICNGVNDQTAKDYQAGTLQWHSPYDDYPMWSRVDRGLVSFVANIDKLILNKKEAESPEEAEVLRVLVNCKQLAGVIEYEQELKATLILEGKSPEGIREIKSATDKLIEALKAFIATAIGTEEFRQAAKEKVGMTECAQMLRDLSEAIRVDVTETEVRVTSHASGPLLNLAALLMDIPLGSSKDTQVK